ncbi:MULTISPECIES: isochorismatase family protein [unclassified Simplicispira]|uniref:isochorismatase family protein n=1 Tax=unclassified Simplicispira TaxID=2630407 RepID=UPI000D5D3DE1|nr:MULTISPECIES: isochorismatase family protein [unclassified Simplicispira]PVY56154.1 maleamate amidohydrolase [Simplicispira sp. 125]REG17099.1 maleamate amidohydrolase [Simplicispira sp. 110]
MNRDDLIANYAAQGAFGAGLGTGTRQAVLMVDFAQAYFEQGSPLYAEAPQTLEGASALLAWARSRSLPVLHTRVEYDALGVNGGYFFRKVPALKVFCVGNPLGDFAPAAQPLPGEPVVTKQYASAFFGTSLASTLRSLGVDCVLIAGMSTSGCVRATALDTLQNGFIPIVVADACGDRHPAPHETSLFDLQAKYADVMTFAQVQAALDIASP